MAKQQLQILIGLHRAANRIDRETARIIARYGLTMGQFAVLEALYHKGDLTVGQVKEVILSSTGTIPVIVRNLERDNYLIRRNDDCDKRRCILHITTKGRDIITRAYPKNEARIIDMVNVLSPDEQNQLAALLKKIGGNDEQND